MFCSPEPQGSAVTNTQEAKAFKKLAAHPRWFIESLVEGKSMEGKGAQTTILVLKHPWTRQVKANHELFLLKFLKGWTRDIKDIQPESHHPEPPVEPSGPRAEGAVLVLIQRNNILHFTHNYLRCFTLLAEHYDHWCLDH